MSYFCDFKRSLLGVKICFSPAQIGLLGVKFKISDEHPCLFHQYDYDFGFLLDCFIAGSTNLVLPQTQNIAGGKISGFGIKAFTRQNYPDSKVFRFKVPTLDSGYNISGDFHFGFVVLCVNGKTNPMLKLSGFITNPEQFPLVEI